MNKETKELWLTVRDVTNNDFIDHLTNLTKFYAELKKIQTSISIDDFMGVDAVKTVFSSNLDSAITKISIKICAKNHKTLKQILNRIHKAEQKVRE